MSNGEEPEPPRELSDDAVAIIDEMDEGELRAAIEYAQLRRRHVHTDVTDEIEPGPGEEIVRVEEHPSYTEVVKREPCGEGCADCPHGPYLYHVREEPRPEGGTHLHWSFVGPVNE